jgi:hypothetical protein
MQLSSEAFQPARGEETGGAWTRPDEAFLELDPTKL